MKLTDITTRTNPAADGNFRFSTLQEWLDWQERLHFTAIELGLDRCRKVAELMRLLPPRYFVISIAGTNGKGSTSVMLENMLRSAGYRVGIYTSPHLLRYNERIKINGSEVDDSALCKAFDRIDKARGNISLTYFEFGTLAAMDIFQNSKIDIAIMEVGLGGRLDAVNMLDANVSVISTIDIDHEQWLGYDRNSIGREKAGIYRSMRPAICADPDPPVTVIETANLVGANLLRSGKDFSCDIADGSWSWRSGMTRYHHIPVPGNQPYQIQNAAGVLMVLESISDFFPVSQQVIFEQLRQFRMPGRFQIIPGEVPCILDVAHNRQAAAVLAASIEALPVTGSIHLVLGMLTDKNHDAFFRELLPCVDCWYVSTLKNPRGASSSDLAAILNKRDPQAAVLQFDNIASAIIAARAATGPGDRIIITGSFVTVGDAIRHLGIEV
jgi:dihydrofolate synthase/folylpolyglutamate synthase